MKSLKNFSLFLLLILLPIATQGQTFLLNPAKGYDANNNLKLKIFFSPSDSIVLSWSKNLSNSAKLKVGRESGNYLTGSISVSGSRTSFIPGNAPLNLSTGRYYAIVTNSQYNTVDEIEADHNANPANIDYSNEIEFIVEAPNAPVPTSPRGEINDATPTFQWDAIPGVPAYWLIVSSTPFSVVTAPNGEVSVQGANIVWNYITTGTNVRYGEKNSDSPYNTEASPLLSGNEYNYTILNLYDDKDISYASTVFSGAFSFTYKAKKKINSPNLVAPADSAIIYGDENITFKWDPVTDANSYTVYLYQRVSSFAGNDQQIDIPIWNNSTTNTSITFPALKTLTRGSYVWNVMANDNEGNGAISATYIFNYIVEMGAFRVQAFSTETQDNLIGFQVEANAVSGGVSPANPFIVTNSRSYADSLVVGTYEFTGHKDGYFDSTFTYTITKGNLTQVKLYLRPYPSVISGTVVDQDGNALQSTNVEIRNIVTSNTYSAQTSASGTFSIVAPKGSYVLRASKAGYISSAEITLTVDDIQFTVKDPVVLTLDKASLSGKVINDEGKPVILATVTITKGSDVQQTVTDNAGNYSFDLTSGNWKLECAKTGFISPDPTYVNLAAGDNVQNQNLILIPRANQVTGFVYKVIGGTGSTPFEDVTVTATPDAGTAVTAKTNSSGNYTLSLRSGSYTISVSQKGYTPDKNYNLTLGIGETVSNINFTLTPNPSSISGTITKADGSPIERAVITADGSSTESLPNGHYSLSVSAGSFDVVASKTGYITSDAKKVNIGPGQTLTGVNFTLAPNAGVISGKVTSLKQPLLNATVTASTGTEEHTTNTDGDGNYSFSLKPGTWDLTASKSGFVTSNTLSVTIGPGQQSLNNDFELTQNVATLKGVVSDGVSPIENAQITVTEKNVPANKYNSVTSTNGNFNLVVDAGKAYEIKVEKKGYTDYTTETGTLQAGSVKQFSITLTANPSSVAGNAYDNSHNALSSVTVTAFKNGSQVAEKTTGLDGSYLIGLSAGSYKIKASKAGYLSDSVSVTVQVGENLTGINFNLKENFSVITGNVKNTTGENLSEVTIDLNGSNGSVSLSTDDNGNYLYSKLLGGNYNISFSKDGYADTTITNYQINEGASVIVNVTMYPLDGKVSGKIFDSKGNALEGASVLLWNNSRQYNAVSASDGSYSINSVVYDTYNLTSIKSGYTTADTVNVSVTKSNPSVTKDFNGLVKNDASVSGVVKDDEGNILPGVNISVSGNGGSGNALSDNNGNFSITALAPGTYTLHAEKENYSTVDTSLTLNGGVSLTITLIKNKATIYGKVTDVFAQPLPFLLQVTAAAQSGKVYTTNTNSSGEFEFEKVADNTTYKIFTNIYREGFSNDTASIDVPTGSSQVGPVNLEIGVHNSVIYGSTDAPQATVRLKNKTTSETQITTSASDGSFQFGYLPAGNYSVTPSKLGYSFSPVSKDVTLSGSDTVAANFTAKENTGNLIVKTFSAPNVGLPQVNISVVSNDTSKVFTGVTDANGEADFNNIPSDTYIIRASKSGYSSSPASQTKTVTTGGSVTASFTLTKNTAEVSGKVLSDGSAVPDVSVKLLFTSTGESQFTTSNNSGNYKFTNLNSGNVLLTAIKPGYISDTLNFNLSSGVKLTGKDIHVTASVVTIKGKVVYTGNGVSGVNIKLSSTNTYETTTDANGRFKFENVPVKPAATDTTVYDVRINDPNYPSLGEILKLTSDKIGQTITLNDFVIPSGKVVLEFTDGTNPLDGVIVTFTEPSGKTTTIVTGTNGKFQSNANLKAGNYTISAKKQDYLTVESSKLNVTLETDTSYIYKKVTMPFKVIPVDSVFADKDAVVKIVSNVNTADYSGKFYYKRSSAGAFTETALSKSGNEFTGTIPAQYSTEDISYYAIIYNDKDSTKYSSDEYTVTPSAKGILNNLALNPSIQNLILRTGDEYVLTLKIRDGLNNSLTDNFKGNNPAGSVEWETDKPDSLSISFPDDKDKTTILISPLNDGDFKLGVTVKYHGASISQTFVFTATSVPIARIVVNSPQARISNRSTGVQFTVTATDTSGRFILLGKGLTWSVDPPSAGTIDDNGYFVPADTNYIGNPSIIVNDALSGIESEMNVAIYADVSPNAAYQLTDGNGFVLDIPAGTLTDPIQIFFSRAKPGPSKKTYTPLGSPVTYTVSDKTYNIQYSGNIALQGDSLKSYATLTLPVDNSLKFFEGKNKIGKYNRQNKNWTLIPPSDDSPASITTNKFRKFGEYAVLTENEPLGLKYVSVLPTPFSPLVAPLKIGYFLTTQDRFARVTIKIYNIRGELVRTVLDNDLQSPGKYGSRTGVKEITWDGLTDNGRMARNGRYIMKITAEDSSGKESKLIQIVLIK